ncbi:hypothetical protein D9757_011389 [Collybiopsis confluens]|uniref:Cytochrome P450 n=1 Tax=Collybiopsis confluens TaxID=2823264 RepID=A0A8H5LRN7_9AGAR|nr:hypothetical protein D9757_011389 [Collybiopsis confluens]
MHSALWAISLIFLLSVARKLYLRAQARRNVPPGPRGWPILGNLPQVARESRVWHLFDKWKEEYGSLTYLNMLGEDFIIINTRAAAIELCERRSARYSDRPRSIVSEYIGSEMAMPFARYTKSWQYQRRAIHEVLHTGVSLQYTPVQLEEAIILTHKLLFDSSATLREKLNGSAATVLSVIYGKQSFPVSVKDERKPDVTVSETPNQLLLTSDPLQNLSNIGHRLTSSISPGGYLVDYFRVLDFLPPSLAKWKRDAQRDHKRISKLYEGYYDDAVRMDQHRASLCAKLTDTELASGLSVKEKAWVAGVTSTAALETTSTTMSYFLYAMSCDANIQRRAHMELDRVVGRGRIPTISDMDSLPYIRAITQEVLRWNPPLPIIAPRRASEDDWYEGHFIPKNAALMLNIWSMNRDKDVYGPNVDEFQPERFLESFDISSNTGDFTLKAEYQNNDGHNAYGFGRRKCVGRHVADNSLFIGMSLILWALHIEPVKDYKPKGEIKRVVDTANPVPDFACTFIPRFPGADIMLQNLHSEIIRTRE